MRNVDIDNKLSSLLLTPDGLTKIASEVLPALIRDKRDYEGFARKVVAVDPISPERLTQDSDEEYYYTYHKDAGATAAFYGANPDIPEQKIEGEIVRVCILTIASNNVSINLKRLFIEKSLYLERAKETAGQAIAMLEDYKLLSLVESVIAGTSTDKKAPQNASQVVTSASLTLAKADLVSLKKAITQHDLATEHYVMNPATQDDILTWSDDQIDDVTQRELIETGARFKFFGITIYTARSIPLNLVYAFAEKDYTGVIPVLKDLDVVLTSVDTRLIQGFFQYEWVGFCIFNHKAVAKLILGFASNDDKTTDYSEKAAEVSIPKAV